MAKTRLNTEDAFRSIMGKNADSPTQDAAPQPVVGEGAPPMEAVEKTEVTQTQEKLLQTAFYITKKQRAALKVRAALGERPEDKDQSSIVRAALDAYLADTLKTL